MSKKALTTLPEAVSIDLARVKVRDLGFTKQPTTNEIWARIRELGNDLCPAEVGPHLRLQFGDQDRGDYFWVAMEQIADSDGNPNVFNVNVRLRKSNNPRSTSYRSHYRSRRELLK